MEEIETSRENFTEKMHNAGDNFYDGNNYKKPYVELYEGTTSYPLSGNYIYDIVYNFVRYDNLKNEYTYGSLIYRWDQEFSETDREASNYLTTEQDGSNDILNDTLGNVQDVLATGKDILDIILEQFNGIKNDIGEIIYNIPDLIDKYGKICINTIFGVLLVMNINLAVLMLLISFFSGKSFTRCCCCRYLFKCGTHIIWNILAFFMTLAFIIGSLIALIGRLGAHLKGILSYIMSIDNFNGTKPIVVGVLGDAKDYIYTCLHGDGDIAKQLGLRGSLEDLEDVNDIQSDITTVLDNFTRIMRMTPVYNEIKTNLNEQLIFKQDIFMIPQEGESETKPSISYQNLITKINEEVLGNNKKWQLENSNEYDCTSSLIPEDVLYYPKSCKPRDSPSCNTNPDCKEYADIFESIDKIVTHANNSYKDEDTTNNVAASVMKVINNLKSEYDIYLQDYVNILNSFLTTIHEITVVISKYLDDGNIFSSLNGKFIGTNLKIILTI